MPQKILFVANIHKHFRSFHIPYIQYLQGLGYEVHVAANDGDTIIKEADKQYNLPINRNPFKWGNIKAVSMLEAIIDREQYCLIHCHTAMGSVVARLAGRKARRKSQLKIIYTVHGFHFYPGSPKRYWLMYYPIERLLSKHTDAIVTMNEVDYQLLVNKKFQTKARFKIPGVGINLSKFEGIETNRAMLRKKLGYATSSIVLLYIAEFISRKNHKFILDAIPLLRVQIQNLKILFAGRGVLKEQMEAYAEKINVSDVVEFLGFRQDIGEVICMADIGLSVSKQEGLPMNVAEELYAGLPVIASDIRGHQDLIEHGINGLLFTLGDKDKFVEYIVETCKDKEHYASMSAAAKEKARHFELEKAMAAMAAIYQKYL